MDPQRLFFLVGVVIRKRSSSSNNMALEKKEGAFFKSEVWMVSVENGATKEEMLSEISILYWKYMLGCDLLNTYSSKKKTALYVMLQLFD